jgi:hypothetical protein
LHKIRFLFVGLIVFMGAIDSVDFQFKLYMFDEQFILLKLANTNLTMKKYQKITTI